MEYTGLLVKYPTQRELTKQEINDRLQQTQRLDVQPLYQLAVIKMNSIYLESVDKFFAWKGQMTLVASVIVGLCLWVLVSALTPSGQLAWSAVPSENLYFEIFAAVASWAMFLPLLLLGVWFVRKDAFQYTHYPIRLNRKSRTVYAFRPNGTVLSAKWDELFFTLGWCAAGRWDLRAYVLAADRKTIVEGFAFSPWEYADGKHLLIGHWEFLRRFMEDGPQGLVEAVQYYMPVDGKKESFRAGWERLAANDVATPVGYWLMWPLNLLTAMFRWIAMRTSSMPVWPHDVEAESSVSADDPYVRDATANPPGLR